jgi:hypothetical protein
MKNGVDEKLIEAINIVLDEFGSCDLTPWLDYYEQEDPKEGRRLLRAWRRVEKWTNAHAAAFADERNAQ